jgi:hypothetical protein
VIGSRDKVRKEKRGMGNHERSSGCKYRDESSSPGTSYAGRFGTDREGPMVWAGACVGGVWGARDCYFPCLAWKACELKGEVGIGQAS